jgi:predicted nucleotidyltransferase
MLETPAHGDAKSFPLDPATEKAVRAFLRSLEGRYPIQEAFVYGSRARGTFRSDSDVDLAVILRGQAGSRYRVAGDMAGVAFDVMQATGVLVDPLPLWEDELTHPELFSNPALIEAIKRDGLHL